MNGIPIGSKYIRKLCIPPGSIPPSQMISTNTPFQTPFELETFEKVFVSELTKLISQRNSLFYPGNESAEWKNSDQTHRCPKDWRLSASSPRNPSGCWRLYPRDARLSDSYTSNRGVFSSLDQSLKILSS